MRFSIVLPVVLAATALAKPVKRDLVQYTEYDIEIVTVTETVTAGAETPTMKTNHLDGYGWHPTTRRVKTTWTPAPVESSTSAVYVPAPEPTTVETQTSTEPAATQPTPSTSSASTEGLTDYQAMVINHHNVHRANHSAVSLTWNETLYNAALTWAMSCNYTHNVEVGGGGYGQNIAAGGPANNVSGIITEGFYNGEEPFYVYGQSNPSNFEEVGHFTQIVWKDTVSVACATYEGCQSLVNIDPNSGIPPYMTVCNYYPPGNWYNAYAENVGNSLGHASVHWDYTG